MTGDLSPGADQDRSATEVLIVGAGPTGLMAAALLARCGVKVRIVDKNPRQAHESRAFGLQAKSLELFLNMGIADGFLKKGFVATGAQIFVDGKQVGQLNVDDIGRTDTPYSFILMVPQSEIEALLVEDLDRLGVPVERAVEVVSFSQTSTDVVAQLKDQDGATKELRASYLIGADGPHSVVRKTLGLRFDGASYPQGFLLADCKVDWKFDYDHLKLFMRGRELAVYLPLRGRDVARIIAIKPFSAPTTAESAEASSAEPATLDQVQQALHAASGLDIRLSDPVWVTGYRIHHRGVNRYSSGRAFVAGDAAHIHSPAGGQGMNTGLQDAANLAWKLALVLRGHAQPALLETYHAERWPVGQKILQHTDKLFAGMSSQAGWVATLRNMLVPVFAATLSKSSLVRSKAFHFISQLGIRYHDNAFLDDESSAQAPRGWRSGLSAGHRAPNGLIARNLDVFSLIDGYAFHVLALSRTPLAEAEIGSLVEGLAALPKRIGIEIRTHVVAHSLLGDDKRIIRSQNNQVYEVYGLNQQTPQALFFIRPDGYIAYRSDSLNVQGLNDFIRQRFSRRAEQ